MKGPRMTPHPTRPGALAALLVGLVLLGGCGDEAPTAPPVYPQAASDADLAANNRGVGLMGQFDFPAATEAFQPLVAEHPHWLDVKVNLAIALLNRGRPDVDDLGAAMRLLREVLAEDPDHVRARYCVGILLLYRGETKAAQPYFERIAKEDPTDGHAAYFAGDCLWQEDKGDEALVWFREANERDPMLRSAYHAISQVLRTLGRPDEAQTWFDDFKRLEDNLQARLAEIKYSLMGPKALVVTIDRAPRVPPTPPRGDPFAARTALPLADAEGLVWAEGAPTRTDTSITACDIDGDGAVDLFLPGALSGPAPNAVLLRRGETFRLRPEHPLAAVRGVLAALWGDVDNDGLTDVYLCRRGPNQLWRQREAGRWEEIGAAAGVQAGERTTRDGALVDVDHDGDLDLVLLHADAPFEVLANRLDGTFTALPAEAGLAGERRPAVGLVLDDLDGDRDVDLLVLHERPPHAVYVNDRLWRWRPGEGFDDLLVQDAAAGVALDADGDGRVEVYLAGRAGLSAWAPMRDGVWRSISLGPLPATPGGDADLGWPPRLGVLDADGDGALELLLAVGGRWELRAPRDGAIRAGSPADAPVHHVTPLFWSAAAGDALVGFAQRDGPVLVAPGTGRWPCAALTFSGKTKRSDQMRSNASGIGTRAAARVDGRWTVQTNTRRLSGPGQGLQPLVVGLGGAPRIDFVDLLWSDGLLQSELDLAAGTLHAVEEVQRQTSSCPVLFAWDGQGFAFVTDLLGVGGIGFWVAPGEYAPPRPREALLLPPGLPVPKDGQFVLKLGEPMEEACYLDAARLIAYDLPPGWSLALDERMEVLGRPASSDAGFFRREALPSRARDQAGRDVTEALRRADRVAADPATQDGRFIGLTAEQAITLEFEAPLDGMPGVPWLLADGWVEYPYAQTLFGAWQAGAPFEAPTLEARGSDGAWRVVAAQFGYPAGMPRGMALPLADLPAGTAALRLRTTQEIYWDRLAIAWVEPCPQAVRRELPLLAASLGAPGFARRTTGPQRLPHYDYARRAPLWDTRHQRGFYTAFGPVDELVAHTDDAVAIFGPGEEVELRFAAPTEPPPAGWTRRYVLWATGWCKDMDLFTRDGETLGPLPRREPAAAAAPARDLLHAKYQTRYRGGR